MSVTIESARRIGPGAWRLTWSSSLSEPTFYVYRDGQLVTTTEATSMTFSVDAGETPVIDVVDDLTDAPRERTRFPGRLTVAWYRPTGETLDTIDHYRVEEYVASVWTLREKILDDDEHVGYWQWTSRWLEDDTTHQFRVIAVGVNGNQSTAAALSALMVRHPDPPRLSIAYNGAGTPTITLTAV